MVDQFTTGLTFTQSRPEAVLIITPQGVKLRGSDRKPLTELTAPELLEVIDGLCRLLTKQT